MTRQPLRKVTSPALVLEQPHIDTDQIIPARFLTTTQRTGLGAHAFADWRGTGGPLDDARAAQCRILVAGDNFGCGSSREHAPWALLDFGIQAIVSTSFADIFKANAHQNGLVTVKVGSDLHADLCARPWGELTVDVAETTLSGAFGTTSFPLDSFTQRLLLDGTDALGWLLGQRVAIDAFEAGRPA